MGAANAQILPYCHATPDASQVFGVLGMDAVVKGYRAVSLLVWLNADRVFTLGTVLVGLLAGAFLGTALLHP